MEIGIEHSVAESAKMLQNDPFWGWRERGKREGIKGL